MAETENGGCSGSAQPHKSERNRDCSIDTGEVAANGHCWGLTIKVTGERGADEVPPGRRPC